MTAWVRDMWFGLRGTLENIGSISLFFVRLLADSPAAFLRPGLIVRQVYNTGALSLAIIMVSGLFVGMILALQGHGTLSRIGSEEALGTVVALAMFKELGPVVTALLFAGRAGTALASEIGLMRATDQLSGMEMMAVDPVRRVVVPRFLGGVIAMPFLAAIFNVTGIFGAHLIGVELMGVDSGTFWSQMKDAVEVSDVNEGIIKSIAFGFSTSLLAVYEGYRAIPTAEGVSRGTTRSVIISSIVVFGLDYMLTAVML